MTTNSGRLSIHSTALEALQNYQLPETLGFGSTMVPILYKAVCVEGQWGTGEIQPYQPIALDPAAKVLHYSQEVFEGLKAYARPAAAPVLFRPELNATRLNASAERLCMPVVPENLFMAAVEAVSSLSAAFIPSCSGGSLYLRPFMIGVDPSLMLGSSQRHEFYVIASPSMAYHQGAMKVMVEGQECRASLGGTGAVKVGGNYAAAQRSAQRARQRGYDQTLWLDPVRRRYLEELSGMNVFAVFDGELHTPELSGSILPGITRDSLLALARHAGVKVVERQIALEELISSIGNGRCSEFFACGTAAIVSPISEVLNVDDTCLTLPAKMPIASQLHQALIDIQEGRAADPFGWTRAVRPVSALTARGAAA